MRWVVALVALLIAVPPGSAKEIVRVDRARDLVLACRGVAPSDEGVRPRSKIRVTDAMLICLGYMQAVQDVSVLANEQGQRLLGVCAPADTTLLQIVRTFSRYASAQPNDLNDTAAAVVLQSLRSAFPCDPAGEAAAVRRPGQ